MTNFGNQVQFEIYKRMPSPDPERLPIAFEQWESKAREILEDGPFYYVAGGAGKELTMSSNRKAFESREIIPRMLCNVEERDLSINLFGETFKYPVMLAPIGVQSIVHPEGELASAAAAAEMNVPFITSSASTCSMEQIANVMGDKPRWFQLYWSKDQDVTASFLRRAENSGYSAIVVTLDTPMMAWRECDLNNVYLPFLVGEGVGNYLTDPAFCSKLEKSPQEDPTAAIMYWTKVFGNASLTWDDLAFLKNNTSLPIILKGILHPEDAKLALEHGADGIIVSNHGGRQVDGAIGALDALPQICEVVKGEIPVLMDSGIRRGSDVVKAIALGASAVLLGRPYMYGLAVAGKVGVKNVITNLLADTDLTMALSGKKTLNELDQSLFK